MLPGYTKQARCPHYTSLTPWRSKAGKMPAIPISYSLDIQSRQDARTTHLLLPGDIKRARCPHYTSLAPWRSKAGKMPVLPISCSREVKSGQDARTTHLLLPGDQKRARCPHYKFKYLGCSHVWCVVSPTHPTQSKIQNPKSKIQNSSWLVKLRQFPDVVFP